MKKVLLLGVALLVSPSVYANILVPPTSGDAPDALAIGAGSTLVASIVNAPFVSTLGAGDFSGTYSTFVFRNTADPFGAGDLTFVYSFSNAATSGESINRVTGSSFTGFDTDVGFTSGIGDSPNTVDRVSAAPVGFDFANGVQAGASSNLLLVETNATSFTAGNVSFIDDGTSTNVAFQPVPGPILGAGLPGLIAGCGLLIWLQRRRKIA